MRLNRRLLLVPGIAAIIASVALGGISFSTLGDPGVALAGDPSPQPTGQPTTDPCLSSIGGTGDLAAFGEQCISPTEEGAPKSHTPTVKPTEVPQTEVPSTPVPSTPVPATQTPTGGTQGGGLRPPNTGSGDAGSAGSPWMIIAGGIALAAFGVGTTAFGLRRR